MMPRKIPSYILVGAIFAMFSLSVLYSNLVIFSLDSYKPRLPYWDLNSGINPLWNCFQESGLKLFSIDLNTFPSLETCRNFNYGYFSLASFGIFNLITTNATFWGVLQILVFSLIVAKSYFFKMNKSKMIFATLALFSPGIFLLEASGNMDTQIVILLLFSVLLFQNKREKLSLTLICITALFKFYTSPLLLILTFLTKEKGSKKYGIFLIIATAATILYQMIHTPIPPFPAGAQNKFGAMIFGNYARKAGVDISQGQGEFLGILLVLIMLVIMFFLHRTTDQRTVQGYSIHNDFLPLNFLILSGAAIVCYFTALSVDYRLTFVALAGIALIQFNQVQIKYMTKLFPYVWLSSLWFSFPFSLLSKYIGLDLQPIGDIAMVGTMSYFIFQSIFIFKLLRDKIEPQF
jgi:hypothetical protein